MENGIVNKEQLRSLAHLYEKCKKVYDLNCCSGVISKGDFDRLVNFHRGMGMEPPTSFACSSCILWNLKTFYQWLLQNPESKKYMEWLQHHKDKWIK